VGSRLEDFRKKCSYSSLAVLRYLMGYFISKKEMGDPKKDIGMQKIKKPLLAKRFR
jgi:hypothetical protein